ncbi:MAG: Flp pilus assembly protein CpaB [Alsobacter sp.]
MKPVSLAVLAVALVLAGFATYLGRAMVERAAARGPSQPAVTVVAAAVPMTFGTELSEQNLIEVPWPSGAVPDGTFTSKAELLKDGRRVVLNPVQRNEPILVTKITGSGQKASLASLLEPGMRAITVRVDDVRGVAGFVHPSDRVDVLLTQTINSSAVADVLLQNVKVLAVDQIANERQENPVIAKAVTLEVNTEQAQKLVLAQGVGSLSLVLRQPGQEAWDAKRRVTVADLGGTSQEDPFLREQRDKVSALENQIADMRSKAEHAKDAERQEFLNRLAQLESRMSDELRRSSQRPGEKEASVVPVINNNLSTVRVTRGGKAEEYNVAKEGSGTLVRSGP